MKKRVAIMIINLIFISQVSLLYNYSMGLNEELVSNNSELTSIPYTGEARINYWSLHSNEIFSSNNYLYVSFTEHVEFDVSNPRFPKKINSGILEDVFIDVISIENCTFFLSMHPEYYSSEDEMITSLSILQHDGENLIPYNNILNSSQSMFDLYYSNGFLYIYSIEYNTSLVNFLTYEFIYPNKLLLFSNQTIDSSNPLSGSELTFRNNYLYLISSDYNAGEGCDCDIRVLNSTNYSIVSSIGISAEWSVRDLQFSDEYLFVNVDNTLRVYNCSNPTQLVLVKVFNEFKTPNYFVNDGLLFLVTANDTDTYFYDTKEILILNSSDFTFVNSYKGDTFGAIYADESKLFVAEFIISDFKGPFFYIFAIRNNQKLVKLFHSELAHPWRKVVLFLILIPTLVALLVFILIVRKVLERNRRKRKES